MGIEDTAFAFSAIIVSFGERRYFFSAFWVSSWLRALAAELGKPAGEDSVTSSSGLEVLEDSTFRKHELQRRCRMVLAEAVSGRSSSVTIGCEAERSRWILGKVFISVMKKASVFSSDAQRNGVTDTSALDLD